MISREALAKIKILAFDMDDTLLNEKSVLSDPNRLAIMRAMDKGYHVVIATGRVFTALPQDVLAVEGIRYAITSNGARITDIRENKTVYTNYLDKKEVAKIMPWVSDIEIMKEVFCDNNAYSDKHCLNDLPRYGIVSQWAQNYVRTTRIPVDSTIDLILENIEHLENINLIFADLEKRQKFIEALKNNSDLAIFCSCADNIEIGGKSASKAEALKALAEILGTGEDSIMAFGDSVNDTPMLREAAIGVAMGNALPEVKDAADYITLSNAQDGVAHALKELLDL